MNSPLFRQEVLESKSQSNLGSITLRQPPGLRIWCALFVAISVALIAYLVWGQYTQKQRVTGVLMPTTGLVKVVAPQPGVLVERRHEEGDLVAEGDILFLIRSNQGIEGTASALDGIRQEIEQRLARSRESAARAPVVTAAVGEMHRSRARSLESQLLAIEQEIRTRTQQCKIAEAKQAQYQKLADDGFVSTVTVADHAQEALSARANLLVAERTRTELAHAIQQAKAEAAEALERSRMQESAAEQELSALKEQWLGNEVKRETFIRSPIAGRISSAPVAAGQSVGAGSLLVTIVPSGSKLQAEFAVPSKAAGFLRNGGAVRVRVEAFPAQKFGTLEGRIAHIAGSAIPMAESNFGDTRSNEPIYRVRVDLDRQAVAAYGKEFPLQAGLTVDADFMLDTRRLIEWLFEPILVARGKL